jgi:DNA-binding CsgD family transcriptional regulator/NAD(P)-dependent dehydrogenase (short-subunit alcohol dehydrogenase family)
VAFDRVALVTGAARGIGAATVAELCGQGYAVTALDICSGGHVASGVGYPMATPDDLRTLAEQYSDQVLAVEADVRDREALESAVNATLVRFGRLDAVVAAAGVRRFALLGMYLACTYAISYALEHPERVSHLVLFGGSARGWDAMGGRETQALLSLIEQDWDTFVASAFHAWLGWSAGEEAVRLQTESAKAATTPGVTRAMLQAASAMDLTDQLASIRAPVLVFHRLGGRQISLGISRELAEAVPDGRLTVLDGSAASLFFESFEIVLRELLAFLGLAAPIEHDRAASGTPDGLTARERDVLRILAKGETNAEIARLLGISVHTVERHVANLYRKIDARGRADATAFALRHGIA